MNKHKMKQKIELLEHKVSELTKLSEKKNNQYRGLKNAYDKQNIFENKLRAENQKLSATIRYQKEQLQSLTN